MKKLLFTKKGNFADIPVYIITVLAIGIGLFITLVFLNQFNNSIAGYDENTISNQTKDGLDTYVSSVETTSDYIIPIIYISFLAFSIFAARLIPSSPKFIFIGILAMIFLPLAAMMFVNIWDGWVSQAVMAQQAASMTFTPFFLDKMVYFVLFYSVAVTIALFTKDEAIA